MATEFLMPKLGLTMEAGTIVEWLIDDGAEVTAGSPVVRIETDKTETDVEASATGRLHIEARVGETFECGTRIGWMLAPGEAPPATTTSGPATATTATAAPTPASAVPASSAPPAGAAIDATGRIAASPLARRLATERGVDIRTVRGTGPGGRVIAADIAEHRPAATPAPAHAPASPAPALGSPAPALGSMAASHAGSGPATAAARQLADLLGIDIAAVPIDPADGRVTRDGVARYVRDALAAVRAPATPASATPVPSASPSAAPLMQTPSSMVRMTGMRGTIASRMHRSLAEMAQLTLFMDADLDAVVADRARRRADGVAPSYTDYVIAAVARALGEHPIVNSQVTTDGIALLPDVHVGMAVALDHGLVVPVVRDTPSLDLTTLAAETSRLAEAARSGSLALGDLEGGTFSVSTLGMFGVDGFTPVINPPNTAILGVGRLRDDLVLGDDGAVSTTKRATLSLTWDHRVFDGAPAAAFCRRIVELLGDPAALDRTTGGR